MTTAQTLKTLITRDLVQLKQEIEAYTNEDKLWYTEKGIANCAGNLCLHLTGNLNAYIGTVLGQTGYIRNRPDEFELKNIPKAELANQIENTITMVETTLDMLTEDKMNAIYPAEIKEKNVTTGYFLTHLAMHLSYHLGQVNYHRRLLDS